MPRDPGALPFMPPGECLSPATLGAPPHTHPSGKPGRPRCGHRWGPAAHTPPLAHQVGGLCQRTPRSRPSAPPRGRARPPKQLSPLGGCVDSAWTHGGAGGVGNVSGRATTLRERGVGVRPQCECQVHAGVSHRLGGGRGDSQRMSRRGVGRSVARSHSQTRASAKEPPLLLAWGVRVHRVDATRYCVCGSFARRYPTEAYPVSYRLRAARPVTHGGYRR